MIVLDTHALLWCALDPDKLSPRALEICDPMERNGGFASAISVWELGVKIRNGKLDLRLPLARCGDYRRYGAGSAVVPPSGW